MTSSETIEEMKRRAAKAALNELGEVKILGLGSGTTVAHFVKLLASSGVKAKCVPSSREIQKLASSLGLEVIDLNDVREVEVTVDGADEVDPYGNLIKGYGGALLWEKILASCSKRYIIIVDERKIVKRLGERKKLPVEVVKYGWKRTREKVRKMLGEPILRRRGEDPFLTDGGNYILDVRLEEEIKDPKETSLKLNSIPGVVENGIFPEMVDEVLIAYKGGEVKRIEFRARSLENCEARGKG